MDDWEDTAGHPALACGAREPSVLGGRAPQTRAPAQSPSPVTRPSRAERRLADFADLGAVRELAGKLLADHSRIDVLANNAGGVFGNQRQVTTDGHELTFQVNYLASFLLTERLITSRGRVVNTSSQGNRLGRIDLSVERLDGGFELTGLGPIPFA
ncbi:SDR family NAD(P)-dependent oxidoreductase [Kineosporia babensis]|uniref:SDR family NAD(P)-dependent oxidoreductase n=1 Tax=Kineosporia babensis TaxID=499548 RepID=A0A9X1SY21_9ACTN|nr:SDR family NAD(P)-dependent oxidoreductase [Kineosporia babensis]MCD5316631.1 SDR family NAD(P)-dependent oxidoreductase [Kineosporia babensis]